MSTRVHSGELHGSMSSERERLSAFSWLSTHLAFGARFVLPWLPSVRGWMMCVGVGVSLFLMVQGVLTYIPARPPMYVDPDSIRQEIMRDGRWRLTRTNLVREVCDSLTIRRFFRGTINKASSQDPLGLTVADREIPAVASSRPTLAPVFASSMQKVGTFQDWWEYEVIPGFEGSYIVTAAPSKCASGFNSVFTLYVVPVDWRSVAEIEGRRAVGNDGPHAGEAE